MPDLTVNDDILNSRDAEAYFLRGDPRILVGLRATLELLGVELPLYAVRRKPGRTPAIGVAAAYNADHVKPRVYKVEPFKAPAIAMPDTSVAGPGLFASTFIIIQ
jgi:hypothetical protein